ncbi:MAG: glycerophosphodiester phosphodiesterase [Bacillota bacterium]
MRQAVGDPGGGRKRLWWRAVLVALVAGIIARAVTVEPRPPKEYLMCRPVVIAHQGASGYAPSNTMEAFRKALEQGADILEIDVHLTRDNIVVVSHDETIDRMSNGSGYIKDMTLAELRQYDFGYDFTPDGGKTFPYRGKGVRIPTLEELFQAWPDLPVNIELKQTDPPMEAQVWELIQRYQMEEKVLVVSFHGENMRRWRALAGERVAMAPPVDHMYSFVGLYLPYLHWLYNPIYDAFQVPRSQRAGPIKVRFDSERFINLAHRLNMAVHYWTINEEVEMRELYGRGADGVMTDYPDRAVKVLQEMDLWEIPCRRGR